MTETRRAGAPIRVVIVESHDEALLHIHQALRSQSRRLLGKPFEMIHFDSHADLACPGPHIPAYCCFRPSFEVFKGLKGAASENDQDKGQDLYDLLHSTASGIAEWILPLVLAANLEQIHWIRPRRDAEDAFAIPIGQHRYRVGAWCDPSTKITVESFVDLPIEAQVKVDSPLLYYMEDDSTVPPEELLLPQLVSLEVSEGPIQSPATMGRDYVLDICLDFFCCTNPFMADLELKNPAFASSFRRLMTKASFHQPSWIHDDTREQETPQRSSSGRCALEHTLSFRNALVELLRGVGANGVSDCELRQRFASFFDNQVESIKLLRSLIDSLLSCDNNSVPDLVEMAIEAIPYAMMPHDAILGTNQYPWIDDRMQIFEETLRQLDRPPFIVTIARSALDGFTSPQIVQQIQDRVVALFQVSKLVGVEGCIVENDWVEDFIPPE